MISITKALAAVITGLVLGVAIVFLISCATVAAAWFSGKTAAIPGVFRASFGEENGMPALSFDPSGAGMLVVIGVIAIAYVCAVLARTASRKGAHSSLRG